MRVAYLPKVLAVLFAVAVIAAPMATAEDTGAKKAALEAKETLIDKMEEGVHEVPKHKTRAQKPRIGSMGARQTWDECLGMDVAEAIGVIKAARPDLRSVVKVKEGSMVTMDMRMDRVRVFCDDNNVVTRAPRVG